MEILVINPTNDIEQFMRIVKMDAKENATGLVDLGIENELDSK
jgi:hypothetical protein